jgi:hypothetical protein
MTQRIDKQIRALPAIKTEAHFFQIGWKMLGANPVPRTHDAALEKRESGFDGIRVNVAHDVHARTVVNSFVIRSLGFPHSRDVRYVVIGENDFHVFGDILADVLSERSAFRVSGMKEAEIAVALTDADHYFFVVILADLTFATIHAPNVGNVHLDFAIQHRFIGLRHSVTDTMAEVPCRFVAHSDRALNLAGRHAFLCFAEQVRCEKPLGEREMGIVEHRAGSDRKLVVTILAVEELLVGVQFNHRAFAAQAVGAFGEAQANQKLAALVFGAKQGVYVH